MSTVILIRRSKNEKAVLQHFQVIVQSEYRSESEKLSKDTASGPDVNTEKVILLTKDYFRSTIPKRNYRVGFPSLEETDFFSQTKIC